MMALILTVAASLHAQGGSVSYKFSGVYTWGKILTMLCEDGYCRTALPREFYELTVPVSIYENDFEGAFKALSMQALADGWVLSKKGKKYPFDVSVRKKEDRDAAFVSCVDSSVQIVPDKYLGKYISADSLKCLGKKI